MPDDTISGHEEWSDEVLLSTAAEFAGVGSDAGLSDVDRFRAAISRLVAKTLQQQAAQPDDRGLSVFLLQPTGPPASVLPQSSRVPMLDQGREVLDHRVWFVTHVASVGTWVPAQFVDDDDLFRFVTNDLGLGGVPTVIFDPRLPGPELRYYPNGLDDPESHEALQIANEPISLDEIFRRIDAVWANQLVTPGAQPRAMKLWANAERGQSASNAEDLLSGLLAAGLQSAFPTCHVRVEQPQPTGRLDIEVEERIAEQPGAVMRHAILELKVLRGRNPNGTAVSERRIRTWVEDGVGQAAAYREDKGALAAALCCFDMRSEFTDRQCFAHVAESASELEVELRVWHLFASAAAYRRYLVSSGSLSRAGRRVEREMVR